MVYAQPGVKKLKYDVFTPDGARNRPAIIIVHGGGWVANREDIMRGLVRELVQVRGIVFALNLSAQNPASARAFGTNAPEFCVELE